MRCVRGIASAARTAAVEFYRVIVELECALALERLLNLIDCVASNIVDVPADPANRMVMVFLRNKRRSLLCLPRRDARRFRIPQAFRECGRPSTSRCSAFRPSVTGGFPRRKNSVVPCAAARESLAARAFRKKCDSLPTATPSPSSLPQRPVFVESVADRGTETAPRCECGLEIFMPGGVPLEIGDARETRVVPIAAQTRRRLALLPASPKRDFHRPNRKPALKVRGGA